MSANFVSFSLFGNRFYFTPKLTLISLCTFLLLVALGLWQVQAAKNVRATIQLANQRLVLDPLSADDLEKSGDLGFYPIQLQGTFDTDHQILLSNRMFKGQRGYQVLTPFKPANAAKLILVNRGWIPEADAGNIPALQVTEDNIAISGVLFQPEESTFTAGFDANKVTWPLISKTADIDKIDGVLDGRLYPYIVLLSPSSQYGFVREWLWLTNTTAPDRHLAYAKKWFVLAGIVVLLFIFLNIHRMD